VHDLAKDEIKKALAISDEIVAPKTVNEIEEKNEMNADVPRSKYQLSC